MDKERLRELKEKSTSGSNGKRKEHPMRITREEYLRKVKKYTLLTALGVASLIGGGKLLYNKIANNLTINITRLEYYNNLVGNGKEDDKDRNWHPTQDGHYWYDYSGIAHDLENLNPNEENDVELDIGISSLISHIGEYQTNQVLNYTKYDSLEGYLESKGFEDTDSFQKEMDKEILTYFQISKKEKELSEMRNEDQSTNYAEIDQTEMTGGGK